jgi:tetratricopeptide (TPR) repeat protein
MSAAGGAAHAQFGLRCLELRRFADAERHFKDALALEPDSDTLLGLLAHAVHLQDDRDKEALEIINRAIAVEPNDARHHTTRAFILNSLNRPKEALVAARLAQSLEPHADQPLAAQAQAHYLMKDWADAERAARAGLAIDPENSTSANLLAEALRNQGRSAENREQIAGMLARDPEDALTHHSAGWAALQRGDHRAAESHFREALRLSPGLEPAREGLLASFRSRSPFYRGYLRYCLWMARLKEKSQWAMIIGIYIGYRLLAKAAGAISPTLAFGVVALYLLLVLWAFVANAVGNFILLMDRFARHALKRREKIEAIVAGGAVVAGLVLLGLGFGFGLAWALVLGAALALGAIPWSLVFTNPSRAGRMIFGAVGMTVWIGAACFLAGMFTALQPLTEVGKKVLIAGGIGVIVTTWLAAIPALRR